MRLILCGIFLIVKVLSLQGQASLRNADDLKESINTVTASHAGWEVLTLKNGIRIHAKSNATYCSELSRSYSDDNNCWEEPLDIYLILIDKVTNQYYSDTENRNRQYLDKITNRYRDQLLKTFVLDTRSHKIRRKIQKGFTVLPTHAGDAYHDLLVFTTQSSRYESLKMEDAITQEYNAILEGIKELFPAYYTGAELPYLGFLRASFEK